MKIMFLSLLWLFNFSVAQGKTVQGSFRSQGRDHQFHWDDEYQARPLAVREDWQYLEVNKTPFYFGAFEQLGWRVELTSKETNGAKEEGLAIWFGNEEDFAPAILTREFIVGFWEGNGTTAELMQLAQDSGGSFEFVRFLNREASMALFRAQSPESAAEISSQLATLKSDMFAHPNFVLAIEARGAVTALATEKGRPQTAPYFDQQWNLKNTGQTGGLAGADIKVEGAWATTLGDPSVVVGLIDLGFEQSHHAMAGAWYLNLGEIAGNGQDDDHNGLKEDVSGWNYAINGPNLIYGALNKHGTATAGIVGARLDGRGTVGICPLCTILPLVIDNSTASAVSAFFYARDHGARVISNSWGYSIGTPSTDALVGAIKSVAEQSRGGQGIPVLFAMSNFDRDDCRPTNPDISAHPSVLAVSVSNHLDQKTGPSGHGPCLKILAPSSDTAANGIPTVDRVWANGYNDGNQGAGNLADPDYNNSFYGTSAAAPQVAGVVALLVSVKPDATREQLVAALLGGADKINPESALYDRDGHSNDYGFGRLNASRAMEAILRGE